MSFTGESLAFPHKLNYKPLETNTTIFLSNNHDTMTDKAQKKQEKPVAEKKATANEVLTREVKAVVGYGPDEYEIKTLKISQILKLVRIISSQAQVITDSLIRAKKDKGATTELEDVLIILEALDEKQVLEVISTLLEISHEEAEENFNLADVLEIINTALELEELDRIFFQVAQIQEKFTKAATQN